MVIGLWFYPCALSMGLMLWATPNTALMTRFAVAALCSLSFSTGLVLIYRALPAAALRRFVGLTSLALLCLYTFSLGFHFWHYGQLFGVTTLYSILESTSAETSEYLRSVTRLDVLAFAFVLTLPLLLSFKAVNVWLGSSARRKPVSMAMGLILLGVSTAITLPRPNLQSHNPWLFISNGAQEAFAQRAMIRAVYATMQHSAPAVAQARSNEPATHILIIGESTTSKHMSLYGYARKTTPKLDAMRPSLQIVRDACSSRGNTAESLKEMLTFATRDRPELLFERPNLIQLMNSAGFRTYWLSNQQKVGNSDSWSEILSSAASTRSFVNRRGWTDGISLDDGLLPELTKALADSANKRFIVVHLLGTHAAYALRYPSAFKVFDNRTDVHPNVLRQSTGVRGWLFNSVLSQFNDYDNAVLYNDHMVASIIAATKDTPQVSVTYLSDHGESLGEQDDFLGHIDGPAPKQVYQIPLFFYVAPQLRASLGSRLESLHQNLAKPFQSDQLVHSLLDLYGVEHSYADPQRSLVNPAFVPVKRFCDTLAAVN